MICRSYFTLTIVHDQSFGMAHFQMEMLRIRRASLLQHMMYWEVWSIGSVHRFEMWMVFLVDYHFIFVTCYETTVHGFMHCKFLLWCVLQLRNPTHPSCSIPTSIHCLSTSLREPYVRTLFVQADGIKLLIPLISPAATQQSIQVIAWP
jgi:hypothetical protein